MPKKPKKWTKSQIEKEVKKLEQFSQIYHGLISQGDILGSSNKKIPKQYEQVIKDNIKEWNIDLRTVKIDFNSSKTDFCLFYRLTFKMKKPKHEYNWPQGQYLATFYFDPITKKESAYFDGEPNIDMLSFLTITNLDKFDNGISVAWWDGIIKNLFLYAEAKERGMI